MQPRTIIPVLTVVPVVLSVVLLSTPAAAPARALPATASVLGESEKKKPKWWRWEECRRSIDLTDEQSDRLEAIFQERLPELHRLKDELDRREAHLNMLLVEGSSEAKVRDAIDRTEEARSDLGRTNTYMLYRMYKVLSPDQRRKLKTFWAEREEAERGTDAATRASKSDSRRYP